MFSSLFSARTGEFGLLIDIGSGSTLTSVVVSHPNTETPEVIWSNREHQPLHSNATPEQITKSMIASLMNASLAINTDALRALHTKYPRTQIGTIQVTVAAPWSYTIPQTVIYSQTEPINVTSEVIKELTAKADQKVGDDIGIKTAIAELGLSITHKVIAEVTCNGYVVSQPLSQIAQVVTLTQLSSIVHTYLTDAVTDIKQKTIPDAELLITTSMLAVYETLRAKRPSTTHAAIISIGYEATEVGVVRDGVLAFTTHTPVGLYTLVRQISEQTDLPSGEVFGYFGSPEPLDFTAHLSEQKKKQVKTIFKNYERALEELFQETGDGLILPSTILLNCEAKYLPLLVPYLKRSINQATHNQPTVQLLSAYLGSKQSTTQSNDSIAFVTAQFFHMTQQKQGE